MAYHKFKDEDGNEYGSFETIRVTRRDKASGDMVDAEGNALSCGWYWVAGFPGCLWDGEPCGPFRTETAAIKNALEV